MKLLKAVTTILLFTQGSAEISSNKDVKIGQKIVKFKSKSNGNICRFETKKENGKTVDECAESKTVGEYFTIMPKNTFSHGLLTKVCLGEPMPKTPTKSEESSK